MSRLVVKFGGTSLGNGERMALAANSIRREHVKGTQIAVVVSAMGHTTDELVHVVNKASNNKVTARDLDEIMSMGERTSAKILSATLRSLNVDAKYIGPEQEEWPVITDSKFGMARIDLEETKRMVRKYILPLMEKGLIPVICGFLGKNSNGEVTTLGRGGSDITGFLIGKCVDADEVIIVTDVDGVMSADPNKIREARLIRQISVEELRDLARFGAQVMHPRAMDYKDPKIDAKVIHFRHGNLSARGTTIVGPREEEFVGVRLQEKPLAMLTIVGENMQTTPGVLVKAAAPLSSAGINIFGVSIGPRSFSMYVAEHDLEKALKLLHAKVLKDTHMKSVTSEGNLAVVIAESEKFIHTPGIIAKLTEPLAKANINIVEILSSRASVSLFVSWGDRERAIKLLKQAMKTIEA